MESSTSKQNNPHTNNEPILAPNSNPSKMGKKKSRKSSSASKDPHSAISKKKYIRFMSSNFGEKEGDFQALNDLFGKCYPNDPRYGGSGVECAVRN